jgi:hypothetical protein
MSTTYGVDVLQINSSIGDSAIHLQLQLTGVIAGSNPSRHVNPKRPYVLKAILLDGGDNSHEGPSNLWQAIQEVGNQYEFDDSFNENKICKFDAVIITHWVSKVRRCSLAKASACD